MKITKRFKLQQNNFVKLVFFINLELKTKFFFIFDESKIFFFYFRIIFLKFNLIKKNQESSKPNILKKNIIFLNVRSLFYEFRKKKS